jgi:signal recognition particle subunit SRP72
MTATDFNEIDDSLPVALQTVQKMNRALAQPAHEALKVLMETTPDDDDKLMSALQKRIWYYNRAVLQLRASKYEDCLSTCQFLQTNALMQKSKKKSSAAAAATKNMHLAVHNKEDRAWWESRVSVLLAHVAAKTGKGDATAILDACLENCIALPQSNVRDHAIMYVQLHKAALSTDSSDPIHLLQALLPESLRNKPAVIATAAALYHSAGNDAKASELLQSVGDEQALADFALSQGNYEKAASIYEKAASASSDDPVSKARWVRALSYTDPNKAMKLWSEMSPDLLEEDGDEVNGAELEARELPRFKSTRRNEMVATNDNNTAGKKSKKSHAAVLRQRARKREKYLAEQEKKGLLKPDAKPDPERWLPKYERSNARRRKSRGQPKGGAQGGISEKDAAKLDVVARQAARASGIADSSGPSTAHMTVSGGTGGRKGKRR